MAFNLCPHSVNTYAISKLMYRCNTIDLIISYLNYLTLSAKSFIYIDHLERPEELILYIEIDEGGLGLYHITSRTKAHLITTFLQTAINPAFRRNHYHNDIFI